MKKILLFTTGLLFATASTQVQAQNSWAVQNAGSSWQLGPVAGFGHSYLSNMDNQDFKPSYHLGIAAMKMSSMHWGWGAELTASHEGFKMESPLGSEMSVDPIYARLTPKVYYFFGDDMNMVRPHINVGPSVAYKVDEDQYSNDVRLNDDVVLPMYNNEVFNDFDLGVNVGAGANVAVSDRTSLNFDANYYNGFLDATDMDNRNRNIRFNMGVMFDLNR